MGYYPIALDLTGKACLVVGGGEVAYRKAASLVEAGARVTVISPTLVSGFDSLPGLVLESRLYSEGDASGFALVFACTDDQAVNAAVAQEAKRHGALVNAVDDPAQCSFIAPSVVRRGDLLIAITTSGKSPTLSRRIRQELEERYGPEYAAFVDVLGEMRERIKELQLSQDYREKAFERLLDGGILELLRDGKVSEARKRALDCIS